MSGDWPPQWEDEDDLPAADDRIDTEAEARLREVAASLAAAPAPALPDAVAARISAAIAAEAADRASVPVSPAHGRSPGGRDQGPARPRCGLRSRPLLATASAVACLVLLGFAVLLSRGGSSSSSATANSAMRASSATASGRDFGASEAGPVSGATATAGASFSVTESGTAYRKGTLTAQVRARLSGNSAAADTVPQPATTGGGVAARDMPNLAPNLAPSPVPSAGSAVASGAPASQLRGCVLYLTGGVTPKLVDQATYQGEPAYVIATTSHVWVVGRGCTAASPELIVSASLAG